MDRKLLLLLLASLLVLPGLASAQVPDTDGDGVLDDVDTCPAEDASFFDGDGDGCIDPLAHARHIEFWAAEDLPLTYVVHEGGAPFIDIEEAFYAPGQEIDAVVAGIDLWAAVPGVTMAATFAGTTPDSTADGTDGVNQITFRDPDFISLFGNTVIAVGLTTSFTEAGEFNGQPVRPGQIVDADMLFNPTRSFSANTSFSAVEVEAVAVHEAGHLFGLNHSALVDATMFPALPAGFDATTLETDDQMLAYMSYPDPATIANATSASGTVIDGSTGMPIPGAAVFALTAGSDEKVAVQFTLPDGSWQMAGLPAGSYDFFVAPLDGGSDVNGVVPGFINALVDSTAQTVFLPDFYDDAESADEDPEARTSVTLAAGAPVTGLQVITNADNDAPLVQSVTPANGAADADANGVVLVRFTEPIEFATVSNAGSPRFRLEREDTSGPVAIGGQLVAIGTKDVLVFTPTQPLTFDANYTLTLDAGIEDRFGNATTAPFVSTFTVEPRPPLNVTSVSPSIVVGGSLIVLGGEGFEATGVTNNTVTLGDGTPLNVIQVTPTSLVAQVPTGVALGVTTIDVSTSTETLTGAASIEVVDVVDTARATPVISVPLTGLPAQVSILPDLSWALAATDAGLEAVVAEGSSPAFGTTQTLPLAQGLDGIAVDPTGTRSYAVSRDARRLYLIDTDDGGNPASPLPSFLTTLDEVETGAAPLGIAVDPTGREAWITTSSNLVQVWDLEPGNTTQIGEIDRDVADQTFVGLKATIVFGRTGDRVYFLSDRDLHVVDAATRTVLSTIDIGAEPAGVVESPQGDIVYVTDVEGNVSVIPVTATAPTQVIAAEASFRGIAIGPTGGLAYVADRRDEEIAIVDLRGDEASFRTVVAEFTTGEDPIDLEVTPDGSAVFSVSEGSRTLDVFGIGFGPVVDTIFPAWVTPGQIVAVGGSSFTPYDTTIAFPGEVSDVDFDGTLVGPTAGNGGDVSFFTTSGWARVPAGYDGGPIRVESDEIEISRRAVPKPSRLLSNPVFTTTWTQAEIDDTLTPMFSAASIPATDPLGGALNLSVHVHPKNHYAIVDDGVDVKFIDLREDSPTFLTIIKEIPILGNQSDDSDDFGSERAFTPDGRFVYTSNRQRLNWFDADVTSPTFGQRLGVVDFSAVDPTDGFAQFSSLSDLGIAPNGALLFIGANLVESTVVVPLTGQNANTGQSLIGFNSGITSGRFRFHPNGRWMFVTDGFSLDVVDLDPFSSNYLQNTATFSGVNSEDIEDVAIDTQGRGLWALTRAGGLGGQWNLWWADFVDDPADLLFVSSEPLEIGAPSGRTRMELHPNGLRAAVTIPERRVAYVDLAPTFGPLTPEGTLNIFDDIFDITSLGLFSWTGRWAADGKRYLGIEQTDSEMRVFDYTFPGSFVGFLPVSGANQTGVAGERLPAPLRVRAQNEGGNGISGMSARVLITGGDGTFDEGLTERILVTDSNGEVSVDWTLGATPGTNSIRFERLTGAGNNYTATGVTDPASVPIAIAQILPLNGTGAASVTTAAQVVFSRAVDRASVPAGTIVLRNAASGSPVAAYQGFSDGDRRISLIPTSALAYETDYLLEIPATVTDLDGNPLGVAASSAFTTQAAPAPTIGGVSPPAGTVGTPVVVSGSGFDPAPGATTVTLNGLPLTLTSKTVNSLRFVVPSGAATGALEVAVNGTPAGSQTFTVLVPSTVPVDEIDDTVDLGEATQGLAVLPSGAKGYAVATTSNQVIPVDLLTLANGTPIAVGDEPVAAASDVNGNFVYVANRGSNSLSVIETATDTVVDTIFLDASPEDIVVSPNGDHIYVVTPDAQAVEVIDVDTSSASYNTAIARFNNGTSTSGASISPDGTILFLGTSFGFITIDLTPTSFGAMAQFNTGASTSGASISPDGTILILLAEGGEIILVDIDGAGFGTAVARFNNGANTSGASISPDGAILYVITADTDEILAYAINVSGSVSAIEGLFVVELQFLRSIDAGDDPRWIAFDPRDPQVAFVGATGDLAINVFGRVRPDDPTTCESFEVVFGTSWDPEPSLQEILDAEYGVGAIDAVNDYEGAECDDAAVPYWLDDAVDGWIVREIGDYQGRNTLGWYAEDFQTPVIDGVDDGVIFDGSAGVGTPSFVGLPGPTRFGLYLNPNGAEDAINAPEPELFFTNRRYNDEGPDGSGSVHLPAGGDAQALIYDITALRNGVPTYVIAWEDVDSGAEITAGYTSSTTDNDFNDLVIEIHATSPVSAVVTSVVAVAEAEGVRVAWNVSGAVAIDGAVVERRGAGGDFDVVGRIEGRGSDFVDRTVSGEGTYVYRVAVFVDGGRIVSQEVEVAFAPSAVRETGLVRAYPNPFNPQTTIEYGLARAGDVQLRIYNLAGRLVKSFDLGAQPVGTGRVQWTGLDDEGRSVSSGVYLVKLVTPEKTDALRVMLLK